MNEKKWLIETHLTAKLNQKFWKSKKKMNEWRARLVRQNKNDIGVKKHEINKRNLLQSVEPTEKERRIKGYKWKKPSIKNKMIKKKYWNSTCHSTESKIVKI